jgi:tetratricopeptide (TPR) repeat protein
LGRVFNLLTSYYGLVGRHDRSIEFGTRGLQINRDDVELSTVTHYLMGAEHRHVGEYDRSIAFLRQALLVAEEERFKHERFGTAFVLSVTCRIWLAQCYAELGRFKDARTVAEDAITIAKEADHISSLAYAQINFGFVHLVQGSIDHAIGILETSHNLCRANNIQVLMPHIGSNLGYAYALAGRLDEAIPLMEKADEQSKLIGRKAAWALRLTWLGHASLLAGQIGAAQEHAQRAVALARDVGERGNEAWARRLLGDVVQEESSNPRQALDHYAASMELAKDLVMRPLEGHIHLSRGRLHRREGQIEKATTELSLALASYRSMEMPLWIRAAEQELSTLPD